MEKVLNKYGISRDLSTDQKLSLLEKEKLKVLRKLNHVFGNPEKEAVLSKELEAVEQVMDELLKTGGKLSLDDIVLETKGLTQIKVDGKADEKMQVREKERRIAADEEEPEEIIEMIYDVLKYYLRERSFEKYEYWLLYGARLGIAYCMKLLHSFYTNHVYESEDEQRAFYWLEKGAELGDKDCLEELGLYYADAQSEQYNPSKAAICFVKAADSEHANSYIFAFQMFHRQGDYQKAETCLMAADRMEIQSAAHWFGVIYSSGENSRRTVDMNLAQKWLEKEYRRYPNGAICYDLGSVYLKNGDIERGIAVLEQGEKEFASIACKEVLNLYGK